MIWSTRISETDLVFEISFYIRLKLFLLRSLSPLNLEISKQHILPSPKNFITFARQSSQHVEILGRSGMSGAEALLRRGREPSRSAKVW